MFVSGRHNMSMSCFTLLSTISCNVNPSSPTPSPFGFCKIILVISFFVYLSLSPNGLLSFEVIISVSVVCVMCDF